MRGSYCVTQRGKNGFGLVDAESESKQRKIHTTHYPIDSNPIWSLQVRLGSSVLRGLSRGSWIPKGKKEAYQPPWIKNSSYSCNNFRREAKTKVNPLTDEQSGSISVHKKNGRGGQGKGNQKTNKMGKQLWQFLIENAITIIVEYIPAKLNTLVEKESQKKDNNE